MQKCKESEDDPAYPIPQGDRDRYGVEFKAGDAPEMTKSLHIALSDLKLERAWIVYPGTEVYAVHEQVEVGPLGRVLKTLARLR